MRLLSQNGVQSIGYAVPRLWLAYSSVLFDFGGFGLIQYFYLILEGLGF